MIRVAFRPEFPLRHEKENAQAMMKATFLRRV
jgi:hypothetical protein